MKQWLQRRLKRLSMCFYFWRMYKILETRWECQASYDYWQRQRKLIHDPYWKWVSELLDIKKLNDV